MAIPFNKEVILEAIREVISEHETDPNLELQVGDYQTKHYHMCPGAKTLYQDIESKVEDMDLAVRAAKLQDALFAMEEIALERGATEADVFAAEAVASQIMSMAQMMGLEQEHSYIQGHVDKIKAAADGMEEAKAIQEVLAETTKDYTLTTQSGKKIHMPFKNSGDAKKYATDNSNIKSAEETMEEETISVGHVDDEPGMLKQYAFDTAEYAAKLYKLLHHYEQMEDQVDFPNWWQHKVMMAREYMSKATHYLEFETREPEIDAQIDNAPPEVDLEEARDYQALAKKQIMFGGKLATVVGEEGDYIRLKFKDGKENLVTKKDFENKQPGVNEIYPEIADSLGAIMDPENAKLLAGLAKLAVNAGSVPAAMAILYKNRNNPLLKKHLEKIDPALVDSNDEVSEANHMHEDEDTPEPSRKDMKAAEKETGGKKTHFTPEAQKMHNIIKSKVAKIEKKVETGDDYKLDLAALKQYISKPEVKKALGAKLIKGMVSSIIGETVTENKATCCGKCGRTHVKGTECKKPFLTGKDHCRVR